LGPKSCRLDELIRKKLGIYASTNREEVLPGIVIKPHDPFITKERHCVPYGNGIKPNHFEIPE
jgi:hypothetical protein